jgi:hypothetical protein
MIDWEKLRFRPVLCQLQPRESWQGQPIKELVRPYIGATVLLTVAWREEDDEKYPGEYALIPADDGSKDIFEKMGITWIASGDVQLIFCGFMGLVSPVVT